MESLKKLTLALLIATLAVLPLKVIQKICWDNKASFINPPSLDAFDPSERYEAAKQIAKKYGVKDERDSDVGNGHPPGNRP